MIVQVNVVLNRTISDNDCCFDNLAVVIFRVKVNCIRSIIDLIPSIIDGIKLWLLSVNNQSSIPSTDVIHLTLTLKMTTAKLSKQQSVSAIVLLHRLSKCQSMSTTDLLRTKLTRMIMLNLLRKWLLGSNFPQFNIIIIFIITVIITNITKILSSEWLSIALKIV